MARFSGEFLMSLPIISLPYLLFVRRDMSILQVRKKQVNTIPKKQVEPIPKFNYIGPSKENWVLAGIWLHPKLFDSTPIQTRFGVFSRTFDKNLVFFQKYKIFENSRFFENPRILVRNPRFSLKFEFFFENSRFFRNFNMFAFHDQTRYGRVLGCFEKQKESRVQWYKFCLSKHANSKSLMFMKLNINAVYCWLVHEPAHHENVNI